MSSSFYPTCLPANIAHSPRVEDNILALGEGRDFEVISCQITPTFTSYKPSHTTESHMRSSMCCAFVLFSAFLFFNSILSSTIVYATKGHSV